MIQRIQTVYLLLAALVVLGLFLFPYAHFDDLVGLGKNIKVTGIYGSNAGEQTHQWNFSFIVQTILTGVLAFIPLLTIFLFKNRKKQMLFIWLEIVLLVALAIWMYAISSGQLAELKQYFGPGNIGVGFFLIPLIIIFLALALGGIRRDQKLIKSVDRLRG